MSWPGGRARRPAICDAPPCSALLGAARAVITIREAGLLLLATLLSGALSIAVAVLAWPGSPAGWSGTFIDAVQRPSVLVPLAALVMIGLLWSIRLWVLRKRLRDPGPILLLPVEDGTAGPVPTPPTIALTQPAGDAPAVATVIAPAPDAPGGIPESPPVARLATHFRVRLSETRPLRPDARPRPADLDGLRRAPGHDEDRHQAAVRARGQAAAVVLPSHAYEVKATVLEREASRSNGCRRRTRGHSKRSRELAEIRARLRPALVAHYSELDLGPQDRAALGFGRRRPRRADRGAARRRGAPTALRPDRERPLALEAAGTRPKRADSPEELAAASASSGARRRGRGAGRRPPPAAVGAAEPALRALRGARRQALPGRSTAITRCWRWAPRSRRSRCGCCRRGRGSGAWRATGAS